MGATEKCRAALRRLPWFRQLLWIIDILLGLLELFLPFPFWGRLLSWLVIAIGNHIITPKVVRKVLAGIATFRQNNYGCHAFLCRSFNGDHTQPNGVACRERVTGRVQGRWQERALPTGIQPCRARFG